MILFHDYNRIRIRTAIALFDQLHYFHLFYFLQHRPYTQGIS